MIYDLHDARRPVVKGRLRRRAAIVRLGGREAMDMAPPQTGIQQSFIVCVLVRPWPRRRCAAAAAACCRCREEARRTCTGGGPCRAASLTLRLPSTDECDFLPMRHAPRTLPLAALWAHGDRDGRGHLTCCVETPRCRGARCPGRECHGTHRTGREGRDAPSTAQECHPPAGHAGSVTGGA